MIFLNLLSLLLLVVPIRSQISRFQSCSSVQFKNVKTIASSDNSFQSAIQPFNLRISPSPDMVVFPSTVDDVSNIVKCASDAKLTVSARSGGHSYAGYGLSGNVVLDLSQLKNLSVDDSGFAIVQTGNLLGELADALWTNGQRALPHGTCPYVGVGGHALYGGFGLFSRTAGLLLDRIKEAEVVLANGSIVTASKDSNQDLFWAIRGGGGSFGIVTAWTFDTLPAPETTVTYEIDFSGSSLNADTATEIFMKWQDFIRDLPPEISTAALFAPQEVGQMFMSLKGTYYGPEGDLRDLIMPMVSNFSINATINSKSMGWMEGLIEEDGSLSTVQPEHSNTFYAKSIVINEPLSEDSAKSWIKYIFDAGLSTNLTWFAQADLYGGIISSTGQDDTAFAHRDAFLVFQFYTNTPDKSPPFPSSGLPFLDDMVEALNIQPSGAYPNYIDPRLSADQWPSLYFGNHLGRLEKIKQEVDPQNTFNFQQGISPASSSNGTSDSDDSDGDQDSASNGALPDSNASTMAFLLVAIWFVWTL